MTFGVRVRPGLLAAMWLLLTALFPVAAHAGWVKAETERFVIYTPLGERIARSYAVKLEDFDALLRHRHGVGAPPPARKLAIYLVGDRTEMRQVRPGLGEAVAGFYSADAHDIFAIASHYSGGDDGGDKVLFHEYVHHFMYQYFPNAYPAWAVEGWAEYFSTVEVRGDGLTLGKPDPDRGAAMSLGWLPMEVLLGKRLQELNAEDSAVFYAQSWLLTHYMLSDPEREKQMTAYLSAVAGGADPVEAMTAATGMDLEALENALRRHASQRVRYVFVPRAGRRDVEVAVTAMSPAADDLLLLNQRLKGGVAEEEREAVLRTVRARAARHPGDRLAKLVLARAETTIGERAAGEAMLAAMLAADPEDAEALQLLGLSKVAAGEADPARAPSLYAQARTLLARADRAAPDQYQTLFAYARTRMADADYPSDNTVNMLLLAHALAPQVEQISLATGQALMVRGRLVEARNLLGPVANNPHGGRLSEAAEELLAQIPEPGGENIGTAG